MREEIQGKKRSPWTSQTPVNRSRRMIRRRMQKRNSAQGIQTSQNCAQARRLVVPFIKNELSPSQLEEFIFHVDNCPECREELDIYYTFYESMNQLEQGNYQEYDFKRRLDDKIQDAHRKLYIQIVIRYIQRALLILTGAILISIFAQEILYIQGGIEDTSLHWLMRRMNIQAETQLESETEIVDEGNL